MYISFVMCVYVYDDKGAAVILTAVGGTYHMQKRETEITLT